MKSPFYVREYVKQDKITRIYKFPFSQYILRYSEIAENVRLRAELSLCSNDDGEIRMLFKLNLNLANFGAEILKKFRLLNHNEAFLQR